MARQALAPTIAPHDATPQLGDLSLDRWLREQYKQLKWDDIKHRIKSGQILDLTYDFEATDLNTMFAAPTQFSGMIGTLDGRIVDQVKLDIQVPEDVALSPQAMLVTQSKPKDLYTTSKGRVSSHIAAGQISLFFRNPYRKLWDQLEDTAIMITSNGGKEEEVRVYTLTSPDGQEKIEVRLHQGGKFLSLLYPDEERLPDGALTYRDPPEKDKETGLEKPGKRWKRIPAPAVTSGHNIRRYDDRLLWSFLHREMSDEIFITHTRRNQRFRVDTLDVAKLVALLDQGGESGFKPGKGTDKTTGQPYDSFTLSSLMEANTREPNPERGLDEGVRMPDGSKYDRKRAHADASYDVKATIALKMYMRKRAPDVMRLMEINADFYRIKPFLISDGGFSMRPVRAFARSIYPDKATLHFGVCANINEEIEERRQAVMIRTDLDQPLDQYSYRGKKLLDMSVEELASMLKSQRGKPDALCEVIDLRKNPPVVPAEMAFLRGVGGDPEAHEANRRFVLSHEELCRKLIQAHSMAMPPMPDFKSIPNPQPEEHLFTGIASPKRYEFEMDGKMVLLTETVHAEWLKALRRNRSIDAVLRRALKPQPVEFENRVDSLMAFIDRMESVDEHLQKYCGTTDATVPSNDNPPPSGDDAEPEHPTTGTSAPLPCKFKILPPPDHSFIPPKWDYVPNPEKKGKKMRIPHVVTDDECRQLSAHATEYLWKLRAELMYDFLDSTTHFTVQDSHGHNIPFPNLNRMKEGDLANRITSGEYTIHVEELGSSCGWSSELMARKFRNSDRVESVKEYMAGQDRDAQVREWQEWQEYFDALRALRMHGAPHEDPDHQRWMTASKALKEIARIRRNIRAGKGRENPADIRAEDEEWGLSDIFMRNQINSEQILRQCEELARRQLQDNPLTEDKLRLLGYDPQTGLPIEHTPYEIPADAKILTIDVPDRMLEEPLCHHNVAPRILMLDPDATQREALAAAGKDTYLYLRGAQSGRTYLAAKPVVLSADKIAPSHYFQEIYDAAATRFADSGMTPPASEQLVPLAVEALAPVPSKIDENAQTLKIARWDDFMATVSPALGYRDEPLTGLVIKDYGYEPAPGAVRLQGMNEDDGKPGQTESGWEVPTNITRVLTLTLAEAREMIKVGRGQAKAAVALGLGSVEELREQLAKDSITEEQVEEAGLKNLASLGKLMEQDSFTHRDAIHFGFSGIEEMKSKLTALFVDHELEVSRPDNRIHFVDIEQVDKAKMSWHRPARRSMVGLAADEDDSTPPPADPLSPPVAPTADGAETAWGKSIDKSSTKGRPRR